MTTPFRKDGEIDTSLVAAQIDWMIARRPRRRRGSTGEGHTLDHAEFRDLIAATVAAARTRDGSTARICKTG